MSYPLLDVFLTMLWFFLWIMWFFLLAWIIIDIFRSHDLGGWGKAGWLVFVVVLPFLGVLTYLIARGAGLADREGRRAQAEDKVARTHASPVATDGHADEIAKLADLRDRGVITETEFQQGKAKVLG